MSTSHIIRVQSQISHNNTVNPLLHTQGAYLLNAHLRWGAYNREKGHILFSKDDSIDSLKKLECTVEKLEVMQLKIKNKSELPATSINHTGKRGLFTDGLRHTFQWGTACKK